MFCLICIFAWLHGMAWHGNLLSVIIIEWIMAMVCFSGFSRLFLYIQLIVTSHSVLFIFCTVQRPLIFLHFLPGDASCSFLPIWLNLKTWKWHWWPMTPDRIGLVYSQPTFNGIGDDGMIVMPADWWLMSGYIFILQVSMALAWLHYNDQWTLDLDFIFCYFYLLLSAST